MLKRVLVEDLKRAFSSYPYLVAMVLCLSAGVYGFYPALDHEGGFAYLFMQAHHGSTGIISLVAPLLVAIPYVSSYYVDKKSGFLKYVLLRTERRKYIISRLISNALTGGSVLCLSFLVILAVLYVLDPSPSDLGSWHRGAFSNLYNEKVLDYIFVLIGQSFIFGATYATLGLAVSPYVNNQYFAIVFPFFVYFLPGIIFPSLSLDYLEPATTLDPGANTLTTPLLIYTQLFLLLGIGALAFYLGVMKKGEEDV